MIESDSSSFSFSHSSISFSIWFFISSEICRSSYTLSSLSKSLMAYHRCWLSGRWWTVISSICAKACSTEPEYLCSFIGRFFLAVSAASLAASRVLSSFKAEIVVTGTPSFSLNISVLILSPFFLTTSIILIAITKGIPTSSSCDVK